jgi:two-component system, NarL family, sensor histidine kinase DesK
MTVVTSWIGGRWLRVRTRAAGLAGSAPAAPARSPHELVPDPADFDLSVLHDPLHDEVERVIAGRPKVIALLMFISLMWPTLAYLGRHDPVPRKIAVTACAWLTVLIFIRLVIYERRPLFGIQPKLLLVFMTLISLGVWGCSYGIWVALPAMTAAVGVSLFPERSQHLFPAGLGALICVLVLVVGGTAVIAVAQGGLVFVMGHFAGQAQRRRKLACELRDTRLEMAKMAVAGERLRIARDLHDLLGHSLSLIAVKTEVARRMQALDPDRTAAELAEIESVARTALGEVRQAVTSYRQPSLAAELASARRAVASAGIACRVEAPESYRLPGPVDTALAWAVREAVTNVIRHSRARHCTVRLDVTDGTAAVEVTDDGVGAAGGDSDGVGGGNGLAGLAERARRLGGSLEAGLAGDRGFRLRVVVPWGGA